MGLAATMKLAGHGEWRAKFKNLRTGLPSEAGVALYQETEIEATECKKRCPVDTGALRASIFVVGPIEESGKVYTMIVCGGPAAPYAIFVHENLVAHHPVGEAKFIESVVMESRPFILSRVAARIDLNRALNGSSQTNIAASFPTGGPSGTARDRKGRFVSTRRHKR